MHERTKTLDFSSSIRVTENSFLRRKKEEEY